VDDPSQFFQRENILQFGSKSKSTPQPYAYHVILPLKLILLKQQNPGINFTNILRTAFFVRKCYAQLLGVYYSLAL
jgi:hypothetical protein